MGTIKKRSQVRLTNLNFLNGAFFTNFWLVFLSSNFLADLQLVVRRNSLNISELIERGSVYYYFLAISDKKQQQKLKRQEH